MGKAQRKKKRRRKRLEFEESLSEKEGGAPEEIRHHLTAPDFGEMVVVSGNHQIDPTVEDTPHPTNVNRVFNPTVPNQSAKPVLPPMNISGILSIFMPRQNRESFIGDLEERYALTFRNEGRRSATIWFLGEVVQSLLSLGFATVKRVSGVDKVIARYRRIGS